tara:strand:+ start:251 stop:427 length:177 start_codon:yes stop_codon:yes gene_type:complete
MDILEKKIDIENIPENVKLYLSNLLEKNINIDEILEEYDEYIKGLKTWSNIKKDFDNC